MNFSQQQSDVHKNHEFSAVIKLFGKMLELLKFDEFWAMITILVYLSLASEFDSAPVLSLEI